MADFDDELDALRRVDPLDPAELVPPDDPKATALFERITMTQTTTTPARDIEPRRSPPPKGLRWVGAAAAAIALVAGVIMVANRNEGDPEVAQPPGTSVEPTTPGGSSTGSCVELYDLRALTRRETAFDGTVVRVDADRVTFTVNEWYRGGDDSETTVAGASVLGGLTSAGAGLPLEPGTRLLVAGDGGFAWSCGFTQPYDAAVAAQWAQAFRS